MRRLWLVLVCAALVSADVGSAASATADQGIVVRVQPSRVAIRELDGSRVGFVVNRATLVTLNGHRVRVGRLRRGDVATVHHVGKIANRIEAIRP